MRCNGICHKKMNINVARFFHILECVCMCAYLIKAIKIIKLICIRRVRCDVVWSASTFYIHYMIQHGDTIARTG